MTFADVGLFAAPGAGLYYLWASISFTFSSKLYMTLIYEQKVLFGEYLAILELLDCISKAASSLTHISAQPVLLQRQGPGLSAS